MIHELFASLYIIGHNALCMRNAILCCPYVMLVCLQYTLLPLLPAQEGVVCGAGSTTSPNLDWYEVSACREAVVRCSPELADVIGESHDIT